MLLAIDQRPRKAAGFRNHQPPDGEEEIPSLAARNLRRLYGKTHALEASARCGSHDLRDALEGDISVRLYQ